MSPRSSKSEKRWLPRNILKTALTARREPLARSRCVGKYMYLDCLRVYLVCGRDQSDLPAALPCVFVLEQCSCTFIAFFLQLGDAALLDHEDSKTNSSRHRAIVMFVSQVSYKCSPCSTKSTDTSDIKQGNHTVSKSR